MGMFDTIIVKDVECPYCHKNIEQAKFQTKDGLCLMNNYFFGEIFHMNKDDVDFALKYNPNPISISGVASCPHCHRFDVKTGDTNDTDIDAFFRVDPKSKKIVEFELFAFTHGLTGKNRQKRGGEVTKNYEPKI